MKIISRQITKALGFFCVDDRDSDIFVRTWIEKHYGLTVFKLTLNGPSLTLISRSGKAERARHAEYEKARFVIETTNCDTAFVWDHGDCKADLQSHLNHQHKADDVATEIFSSLSSIRRVVFLFAERLTDNNWKVHKIGELERETAAFAG